MVSLLMTNQFQKDGKFGLETPTTKQSRVLDTKQNHL